MAQHETKRLTIGTRGSRLALWQANHIADRLGGATLEIIKTSGDRFQDIALQGQADKGFFTKEIEEALLDGRVDLAVHSLKDLPTILPDGLILGALTKRANIADLLLVREDALDETKPFPVASGKVIGATSLRRQALLRKYGEGVEAKMLRGNVPTRIQKLRDGLYDAIIIAQAGVERLNLAMDGLHVFRLSPEVWLPAAGQGVLGIEIRENDEAVKEAVAQLADAPSALAAGIERELLARFEGGCHAAFGAYAKLSEMGAIVYVGHEDDEGDWKAVRAHDETGEAAMETAYQALKQLLAKEIEEEKWTEKIASRLSF